MTRISIKFVVDSLDQRLIDRSKDLLTGAGWGAANQDSDPLVVRFGCPQWRSGVAGTNASSIIASESDGWMLFCDQYWKGWSGGAAFEVEEFTRIRTSGKDRGKLNSIECEFEIVFHKG